MTGCTNCEPIESGNVITITDPQQPYCEQCGDNNNTCAEKLDAKCVVYHFRDCMLPSKLENLGLPSCSDLETILEAIDDMIGSSLNISLTVNDSNSIDLTSSGAANHTLRADLKLSPNLGNIAQVLTNGVFVPDVRDYKVKVDANDPVADYLVNQIIGGTDGCVSNSAVVVNGQLKIVPSLALNCLVALLCADPGFQTCVLNLASDTALTVVDSSTIDFTASGIQNHTLTGVVKVSATAGNAIAVNSDGLYVANSASYTFNNALTTTGTVVTWGGTLNQHTLVNGNSFDVSYNPRKLVVGSDYATFQGVAFTGYKFIVSDSSNVLATGNIATSLGSTITFASGNILNSNAAIMGANNALVLKSNISYTVPVGAPISASFGALTVDIDPTRTLTVTQGVSPRTISAITAQTILAARSGVTPGIVTHLAGIRIIAPYQVPGGGLAYSKATNYYGMLIENSSEYLQVGGDITNKWGIYQAGSLDKNEFHGEVRYYNGLVNASDSRVKQSIVNYTQSLSVVKQLVPKTYQYSPSFSASTKTFVGVIAQDVEGILDHAVYQDVNFGYSDFRFYDHTPLIYAIVNSIKQITGQTLASYTPDPESSAYTGATDGEAKLTDLNSLRVAYQNLKAGYEDLRAKLITAGIILDFAP